MAASKLHGARGRAHRAGPSSALVVGLMASGLLLASCAGAPSASVATARSHDNTYGGLPSWLPPATVVASVVVATARHPQLGIEGDSARVELPSGSTTVAMVGPTVPRFVTPPPPVTRATFTITLGATTGAVPLRASDFALLDGAGHAYVPRTFVGGASSVAAAPGTHVTVRITEVMAVGSGSLRWSPGGRPVMTWEFTVEDD